MNAQYFDPSSVQVGNCYDVCLLHFFFVITIFLMIFDYLRTAFLYIILRYPNFVSSGSWHLFVSIRRSSRPVVLRTLPAGSFIFVDILRLLLHGLESLQAAHFTLRCFLKHSECIRCWAC